MSGITTRFATAVLVLGVVVITAPLAFGQYFGRNQVRYEDLDFKVLNTEHFDVYYYPEEEEAVEIGARMAERWYTRLSRLLDHELRGVQPLILYAASPHFRQTNIVSGIGEGTGGVTEALKRRIVMPFAGPLAESDHVLGHELVHAFQFDLTAGNMASGLRLPLWFVEGMAEYLSLGPIDVMTAAWMRQAAIEDDLPKISDLSSMRYFPYRYGHALWAFIGGRYGDEAVAAALKRVADGASAIAAIEAVTGQDAETLSEAWHQSIRTTYEPLLSSPVTASDYGRALVTDEQHGGSLNIAPSLSPDGKRFIFLSERDLFSIDMFVADAETGEVLGSVVQTATDPHFDSLQFIQSSGSWDPSGERFVFGGISAGQPVLSFVHVEDEDIYQEVEFPDLGEIVNPSWSPDGKSVVFSAVTGGVTDLFLFDVEREEVRRLTEDVFADIHPDWSPEGDRIVFVTDRFSSSLRTLHFEGYRLAILDVSTGAIQPLEVFPNTDHWDPQWTDNGLYFVSDFTGRPNIYRLEVAGRRISEVTSLSAGISGITLLSPAFTVAPSGDRLLFTVREENEHRIYAMEQPEKVAGKLVETFISDDDGANGTWAVLPPPRRSSEVATLLNEPRVGLPSQASRYEVEDYEADLELEYVGQPYIAAGTSQFGSFLGGGISFLWSDMLSNHSLGLQVQSSGTFEDIAAVGGYENRESRWFWGASVARIPIFFNRFSQAIAEIDGEPAAVEQVVQSRQTQNRIGGYAAYPFSRVRRLELSSGFTNYGFSNEADVFAVSLRTGEVLIDDTIDLDAPDSLNVGDSSAALVYDTSILGPTSPIAGTRYRLQAGANYGSLTFSDVLADYRHYYMPTTPVTIATRVLHYGRYGGDSEDPRLSSLYLGYPNLVRGYQAGSFTAEECRADGGCPVFQQLLGSRVLVANVELRVPLFSLFGADPWGGPFPIELALFGDGGYAWSSGQDPDLFGGEREPVASAGLALRVPLQRFLSLEFDFVHPFQRSERGFVFEFNFQQGF